MSAQLEADPPGVADARVLPRPIPIAGYVSPLQLWAVSVFCLLFMYHNYLPLFHSDLWGHVAYGEWMLTHGELPLEDPFAELATGVPVWATAWLGQIVFALADRALPLEGLSHLFAVIVLLSSLTIAQACYVRSQRGGIAVVGALLAFGVAWSRHAVQRPEIFGQFGCAVLLLLLSQLRWLDAGSSLFSRVRWMSGLAYSVAFTSLFALWTNLHGSFIVGLGILGIVTVGRILDRWRITRHWLAVFASPQSQFEWLCCQLAVIGCCLNPYGMDLLVQTVAFPTHPNLKSVLEWYPLEMMSLEGIPMVLSWIVTAFVLRRSRREFSSSEVLLLLALNLAVILRVRMIAWYAPVWAVIMAPHLAEIWTRSFVGFAWPNWFCQRSVSCTAVTTLLLWLTFALSPISRPLLGGVPRPIAQQVSHQTPLGATAWLNEHPPRGLVFAPQWWGDWLVWRGPSGLRVMATTNAIHLLPTECWQDYLTISTADNGWSAALDRYRINTLVVSRELQHDLDSNLRSNTAWQQVFEDSLSHIYVRKSMRQMPRSTTISSLSSEETRP